MCRPAQRLDLALVVEQPVQLGGHQRGEERDVAVVRHPGQGVREGALDHDGLVARDQGPADDLHARDVRRRQRQQPLAAGARAGRAEACTEARTACRASSTRLGAPVDPEVSTTSGIGSAITASQSRSAETTSGAPPLTGRKNSRDAR